MIKKDIEPETKVLHTDFGFGIFKKWNEFNDDPVVDFAFGLITVSKKELTEIDESFNPPV